MTNPSIDAEIKNITGQILSKYKPQKIILFGSAARGEFSRDSDLDFLIIKSAVPKRKLDRMRELRALIDYNIPTDFFIYRPEEIEERLSLGDPFVKIIFKEGKTLYG